MNTNESADLGTAQNNSPTNDSKPLAMSESNLANLISEKFLGGAEQAETDATNTETPVEVEATTDDENTVH